MKAYELIDNLKTNFKQVQSQLAEASDHHLMFMLDEARAALASQKMDARVNVELMSQYLDVVPQKADSNIFGELGESNVMFLPIPHPINYSNGAGIFTVGTADGRESFTRITFSQIRTAMARKYTGLTPKWFFHENAIYIINLPMESTKLVRVRGVFDRPVDVIKAKNTYKHLDPWNFVYPLSTKDAKTVYQIALSGDAGWGDSAAGAINTKQAKDKQQSDILNALKGKGDAKVQ